MSIQLGVIADDFTGATDIASFMSDSGWKVVQFIEVPTSNNLCPPNTDAVVIALKSRSIPAAEAIEQSLACLQWLKSAHKLGKSISNIVPRLIQRPQAISVRSAMP